MEKNHINYLEIQITDSCNLNCKGCSHCANLFDRNHHIPYENIKSDVRRLSVLVPDIREIRILGGEPFLHPNIIKIIKCIRNYFPNSNLKIVTNGLLCLKSSAEVYRVIRENNVALDISLYPPTQCISAELIDFFTLHEIRYEFTRSIQKFAKRINISGKSDINDTYWNCDSKWCHFLRDGILCVCPAPVILNFLKQKYQLEIEINDGMLDIYQDNIDKRMMIDFLKGPMDICRYCTQLEFFSWEAHRVPDLGDWLVNEK